MNNKKNKMTGTGKSIFIRPSYDKIWINPFRKLCKCHRVQINIDSRQCFLCDCEYIKKVSGIHA